jgi:hypothetical protein
MVSCIKDSHSLASRVNWAILKQSRTLASVKPDTELINKFHLDLVTKMGRTWSIGFDYCNIVYGIVQGRYV